MYRTVLAAALGVVAVGFLAPSATGSVPKLLILENFVDYVG